MKMMTTAATIAAVLVSAGAAMATPVMPSTTPVPTSGHHGQQTRDQALKVARRHVERAIDTLSKDANDYGGHRVNAMDDLTAARQDLEQAINQPGGSGTPIPVAPGTPRGGNRNGRPIPIDNNNGSGNTGDNDSNGTDEADQNRVLGQGGSNESLTDVRKHIESAIDALSADGRDFGGFKARAVDKLQAARTQIDDALQFVQRPGVRNGGSGQHVSDANLRFVDFHVRTAIGRLEQDRNDYGGHRVAAINDLQQARGFLGSALAFDNNPNNGGGSGQPVSPGTVQPGRVNTGVVNPKVVVPATGTLSSGTVAANGRVTNDLTLADARQHLETAIDALGRDAHDYGGFRVKAMDALQAARSELLQAMQFHR